MNVNIRTIGGAIGTAIVSSVLSSHTDAHGLPLESGYTTAFVVMAAFGVAAFVASFFVPAVRRAAGKSEDAEAQLEDPRVPAEV